MLKSKLKFRRPKKQSEENNVKTEARAADLTQDNLITGTNEE